MTALWCLDQSLFLLFLFLFLLLLLLPKAGMGWTDGLIVSLGYLHGSGVWNNFFLK